MIEDSNQPNSGRLNLASESGEEFTKADEVNGLVYFTPPSGWGVLGLQEIYNFRELIWTLAARDLKVRYRQTAIGVIWAILQPLAMMTIFTVMFRLMGRVPVEEGVPYVVAVLCGLLPWQLFASTLNSASGSLVEHQNLIAKVYFPRAVLPIASMAGGIVDFTIGFSLLALAMMWYGVAPTWAMLLIPAFILLTLVASLAAGLWLSALNAIYRDIGYVVPFVLQVGFFLSPVVYETDALIPPEYRLIYSLNPMVGVIDGLRWAALGHTPPAIGSMLVSLGCLLLVLLGGMAYFRQVERHLADRI
ncbi:ABC transporter permease [Blastopirellula sp. JC732]|uniref:Transport permease protein n=1 Tax=Blastopirellula sediminis TaxID=2894196 RepID=A0A9X1MMT2_9BACT|nr:ABC transporter permease [Blastopirellula sediminis]MCC9608446.1 ABC transporter permease [Blastopirellula sediminis]MCC9628777.1 ABC transporter permease [Blastopirellula sediminis]